MAIPRKEREKEATFAAIMLENFPRINVRHQTKDPGSSENTKQDICKQTNKKPKTNKQKTIPRHIIFKLQKIRQRKNLERSQRNKTPYQQRSNNENYIQLLFRNHVNKKRVE